MATTTYFPADLDEQTIAWEEQGYETEELCEECGDSTEYCSLAQVCEASLIW